MINIHLFEMEFFTFLLTIIISMIIDPYGSQVTIFVAVIVAISAKAFREIKFIATNDTSAGARICSSQIESISACTKTYSPEKDSTSVLQSDELVTVNVGAPNEETFTVEIAACDWQRFLSARCGCPEKAACMLKAHLQWRLETLPIKKESCLGELRKGKFFSFGYDREDHPIVAYLAHMHNPNDSDVREVVRMMIYVVEETLAKRKNKNQQQFVFFLYAPRGSKMDLALVQAVAAIFQGGIAPIAISDVDKGEGSDSKATNTHKVA